METTDRRQKVFDWLDSHGIAYTWYEHPEAPTIEIARRYWRDDGSKHCKNLFFRNHKGNRHYLVAFDCERTSPSTTSNAACGRASSRSPRSSAWSAGSDCVPARCRPSG